ncbi:MAG: hypothetical protein WA126_11305 [Thermodesulfovibrionales bacterium]
MSSAERIRYWYRAYLSILSGALLNSSYENPISIYGLKKNFLLQDNPFALWYFKTPELPHFIQGLDVSLFFQPVGYPVEEYSSKSELIFVGGIIVCRNNKILG